MAKLGIKKALKMKKEENVRRENTSLSYSNCPATALHCS